MKDVREALTGTLITPELDKALDAYYAQYGAKE